MRVFVTGATGYIGGAVVRAVQQAGHDVVGLARSEQAAEKLVSVGCEPHLGDIADPAGLAPALAVADAVIHTAVGMGGGIVGDADHEAVDAMVSALADRGGTLILTSGLAVYQGYRVPFVDESTPLDDVVAPQRPRVALEARVLAAGAEGVRPVVIRPGHVYGRGSAGIFTRTLLEAARAAGHGVFVGDGNGLFAVLHLDDLTAAYVAALTDASASGRYNLVAQTMIMRDVATAMSHGVGGAGATSALTLDEAVERWGPLGRGLLGGPMVSSVRATAELRWSPSGPSLAYELIHGSLRPQVSRPPTGP
jgi:nucleoside-diphosphate-sugar epimerase